MALLTLFNYLTLINNGRLSLNVLFSLNIVLQLFHIVFKIVIICYKGLFKFYYKKIIYFYFVNCYEILIKISVHLYK